MKALAKTPGVWNEVEISDEMRDDYSHLKHCTNIWANNRLEVQAFAIKTEIGGVVQVNICRHGDIEQIGWTELQSVIHELYGPEAVAVEVYPQLIDEWQSKSNVRVLYVLPSTQALPFGLHFSTAWGREA